MKEKTNIALVSIDWAPSLAIRNLATYVYNKDPSLEKRVAVEIFDYNISNLEKYTRNKKMVFSYYCEFDFVLSDLLAFNPSLIGFSCYVWNHEYVLSIAQILKKYLPDSKIILGGPNAAFQPEKVLSENISVDFVAFGDGEETFYHLVKQSTSLKRYNPKEIPGLVYRWSKKIERNEDGASAFDFKWLKGVYQKYPIEKDIDYSWKWIRYETLRGCPYNCSYCTYGTMKSIEKNTDLVVAEILDLLQDGYDVEITDPSFTHNNQRAKKILTALAEYSYTGSLYVEVHPDDIDKEIVGLFRKCDVRRVGMGLQTISQTGLKIINRRFNKEKFERAVALFKEHDINFYVDVIYGLPMTSIDDHLRTLDYLWSIGVFSIEFYRLLGIPGAKISEDDEMSDIFYNPFPPYEALSHKDYSHRDFLFCQWLAIASKQVIFAELETSRPITKMIELVGTRYNLLQRLYSVYEPQKEFTLSKAFSKILREA